jgi:hypothetical protein
VGARRRANGRCHEVAKQVRLKVRTTMGWKSPSDRNTGLSVAEGNCAVERRGGEQPEANDQSINETMLNSIRPDALASLPVKGEAKNGIRPGEGARKIRDLTAGEHSEQQPRNAWGVWRWNGQKLERYESGITSREGTEFMAARGARRAGPEGDRAFIVARKRGNARGAKGGRKVEA